MALDLYKNIGNSLDGLTSALRIAISNADNFNTPGFKYTYASFTTVYNQVLAPGTETTNPMELGGSMTLGSTTTDFSQGNIGFGTALDAAIVGDGFFILSKNTDEFDAQATKVYTRAGRFQTDSSQKYLTDSFGRKVFGFKLDEAGNVSSNALVPIETDGNSDIGFLDNGILVANYEKNKAEVAAGNENPTETVPLYKLALTSFQNKQGLILTQGAALEATSASGDALNAEISGGSFGTISGAKLESSNIDVAKVALDMALLNRGFSAIQGVIDDVNKIVQGIIQKLSG